jgi:hypothetical protein
MFTKVERTNILNALTDALRETAGVNVGNPKARSSQIRSSNPRHRDRSACTGGEIELLGNDG